MKLAILIALTLWAGCFSCLTLAGDPNAEALQLCGNIHHTDIHLMHRPHAAFSNSHCFLHCYDENRTLSSNPINDGFPCPANPSAGICRKGACVDVFAEAVKKCSELHHTDFGHLNASGTAFVNDHCSLRCAIAGNTLSTNHVNEGQLCETNLDGICRKGECIVTSEPDQTPALAEPTPILTTPAPTTIPVSIDDYTIKHLDIVIKSVTLLDPIAVNYSKTFAEVYVMLPRSTLFQHCETAKFTQAPRVLLNKSCNFSMNFIRNLDVMAWLLRKDNQDQNQSHADDVETSHAGVSVGRYTEKLYNVFQRHLSRTGDRNGSLQFEESFPLYDTNRLVSSEQPVTAQIELKFTIGYVSAK